MVFKPGHPGGPGRPKGSKHKLGESFIQVLYADFQEHGTAAVTKVRETDPSTYLRVVASILPKEIEIKRPLADMTDDELVSAVDLIRTAIAGDLSQHGVGDEGASGGEPARKLPPLH